MIDFPAEYFPNYTTSVTVLPQIPMPNSTGDLNLVYWPCSFPDVRIMGAVDSSGKRGLLFRFKEHPRNQSKLQYQHLISEYHSFIVDGDDNDYQAQFFVHLDANSDEAILCSFIDSITSKIVSSASLSQEIFFGIYNNVLDEWTELLSRYEKSAVPKSKIIGLLGELLVMNDLNSNGNAKIEMWSGPDSDRFDFRLENCSLEVKTSIKTDKKVISVNGVDQLIGLESDRLVLVQVELSPGGICLADIISKIESRLNPEEKEIFSKKLKKIGYSDKTFDSWNSLAFKLYLISVYSLGSQFPSLKLSDFVNGVVPERVSGISYQLDLTSLIPNRQAANFEDLELSNYV